MILAVAIFLIVFEALKEGFKLKGSHVLSASFEFVYLAVITLICFDWVRGEHFYYSQINYWQILGGYVLLRFALFDFVYNVSAGVEPFYIGSTKIYDKVWRWFFRITKFPEEPFLSSVKLIAGLIGVSWLL